MNLYRMNVSHWHITRVVFLLAGLFTLLSLILTLASGSLWWLLLAGFVGLMQVVFALTGYYPSAIFLEKLGVPKA